MSGINQEPISPAAAGRNPFFQIEARSIPEAYYEALRAVHFGGHSLRTQYDRRDPDGTYIDPPGKDAKVAIRIREPFAQPRFPALSYCERGKYIAEFLGAKDHLVVPYRELVDKVHAGEEFEATQWPYCYHQPPDGLPARGRHCHRPAGPDPRQTCEGPDHAPGDRDTRVPEIDLFMQPTCPAWERLQLRAIEDDRGRLLLNMHTVWRSRDLYKAWGTT